MQDNYTHMVFLIDHSGSMMSTRDDVQGAFNSTMEEQKKVAGKATVTLYEFDDSFNKVFGPVDVKDAPTYTLIPNGMTRLRDALGKAMTDTGKFLRDLPEALRPSQVKFICITDGGENDSREYSFGAIEQMRKEQEEKYKWEFIFIGSDMAGLAQARSMGFTNSVAYAATGESTRAVYTGLNSALTSSRVMGVPVAANMAADYSNVAPEEEAQA